MLVPLLLLMLLDSDDLKGMVKQVYVPGVKCRVTCRNCTNKCS